MSSISSSKSNNVAHRHADLGVSQVDVREVLGVQDIGVEPKAADGYIELLRDQVDVHVQVKEHAVHHTFL